LKEKAAHCRVAFSFDEACPAPEVSQRAGQVFFAIFADLFFPIFAVKCFSQIFS
jgi:hypothetical protein